MCARALLPAYLCVISRGGERRTKGIVLIPPPLPLHDSHEHTFKFWLKVGWFSNVPDIIMVSFFDGEVLW